MNDQTQIGLERRKKLISDHPLFVLLSPDDINELANLFDEIKMPEGSIITKEGDIVDSFFIVVSGQAEVTKQSKTTDGEHVVHVAILQEGEAIGLSTCGIFSTDSKRSATIRAKTDMLLLKIDANKFNAFIKDSSRLYPNLKETSNYLMNTKSMITTDEKTEIKSSKKNESILQKIFKKFMKN